MKADNDKAMPGHACSGCSALPFLALQRFQMSGALRIVPSPEQGTSHSTRSYLYACPCDEPQACLPQSNAPCTTVHVLNH